MAENGCLKDGHFQNLEVAGNIDLDSLKVTAEANLGGGLSVTGDTTLSGTLNAGTPSLTPLSTCAATSIPLQQVFNTYSAIPNDSANLPQTGWFLGSVTGRPHASVGSYGSTAGDAWVAVVTMPGLFNGVPAADLILDDLAGTNFAAITYQSAGWNPNITPDAAVFIVTAEKYFNYVRAAAPFWGPPEGQEPGLPKVGDVVSVTVEGAQAMGQVNGAHPPGGTTIITTITDVARSPSNLPAYVHAEGESLIAIRFADALVDASTTSSALGFVSQFRILSMGKSSKVLADPKISILGDAGVSGNLVVGENLNGAPYISNNYLMFLTGCYNLGFGHMTLPNSPYQTSFGLPSERLQESDAHVPGMSLPANTLIESFWIGTQDSTLRLPPAKKDTIVVFRFLYTARQDPAAVAANQSPAKLTISPRDDDFWERFKLQLYNGGSSENSNTGGNNGGGPPPGRVFPQNTGAVTVYNSLGAVQSSPGSNRKFTLDATAIEPKGNMTGSGAELVFYCLRDNYWYMNFLPSLTDGQSGRGYRNTNFGFFP